MTTSPDLQTSEPRRTIPQLDGVRAVAIAAVVAYHLGYLPGGWIGVDVFFVLSGYLITWILLAHGGPAGNLKWFWGRRLRRLLPAVLVLLVAMSVYSWAGGPGLVPAQTRDPALATLLYTANWQQVIAGHSYFAQYTQPDVLEHTWSLAIEEQYYLLWPILLGGLLLVSRRAGAGVRQRQRQRPVVIGGTVALALASAVWMGLAAHIFGPNRAYLGTDTRAWELLLGGATAMLWPPGHRVRGRSASAAVVIGAAAVAAGVATAGGPPGWVWDGGLVAISAGAAGLIVGSVHAPSNPVSRFLSFGPLRWLGTISYSLYLWHWPAIVLMTPNTTGLTGAPLLTCRVAGMLVASCVSYYGVERPLRTLDWHRLGRHLHVPEATLAGVGVAAVAALIVAGTTGAPHAPSAPIATGSVGGPTASEKHVHLDVTPATAAHPYRVWILGDSVMVDSSLGIQAALQATGEMSVVVNSSFPGWSPRLDKHWATDSQQTIATYHPQIVLGTWSWDDEEAASDPAGYLRFLESTIRGLLAPGNGVEAVVLFEFPQPGPPSSLASRAADEAAWVHQTVIQKAWDDDARRATSAFPGRALYLSTDRVFAPGGRFLTWMRTANGVWVRARKLDNTHMCPYGAAKFGALADADLTWYLRLPPMEPGWEKGAWTTDRRYNDPVGACPDDQPPPGYSGVKVPA